MSRKNIEKYIPKAIEILDKTFTDGVIPLAYNGYISSFGASVLQSGLLPTLALFESTNSSSKENKEKKEYLTYIIFQILTGRDDDISLLRYVINNNQEILKPQIMDIAIAIKLSIRTFELKKGEKDE